jgi:hypothetical protein
MLTTTLKPNTKLHFFHENIDQKSGIIAGKCMNLKYGKLLG